MRTVLITRGFSGSLLTVLASLRDLRRKRCLALRTVATLDDPWHPARDLADRVVPEIKERRPDEYAKALGRLAAEVGADVVLALHRAVDASRLGDAVPVLMRAAGGAEALDLFESKIRMYAELPRYGFRVPWWRAVDTLPEALDAWTEVLDAGGRVCLKPDRGVFGSGFCAPSRDLLPLARRVAERAPEAPASTIARLHRLANEEAPPPVEVEELLPQAGGGRLVAMQWLVGPERSVDCVAFRGRLVRAVVRCKLPNSRAQRIEDGHPAVEAIARMVDQMGLEGAFNVQLRDHAGESWLLEVNPRPAGGIFLSAAAGLDVAAWAALLALGLVEPDDVPHPTVGVHVAPVETAAIARGGR